MDIEQVIKDRKEGVLVGPVTIDKVLAYALELQIAARTAVPSENQRDQIIEEVAQRIAETYDWSDARAPLDDLMVMIRALKSEIATVTMESQL